MFGHKLNKYEYFYPIEVVGRGSETQLQVCKNLKQLTKGSVLISMFPVAGLLVMPFKALLGWTRINIIGCVLITAGIVSTYYCTIPHLLYLTYGLLVGKYK